MNKLHIKNYKLFFFTFVRFENDINDKVWLSKARYIMVNWNDFNYWVKDERYDLNNNQSILFNPYFTGLIPVSDVSWQYELSAASILLWIGPNMAPAGNVRVKQWGPSLGDTTASD